ncbi:MAG TPA: ribonuclease P protein component [Gammaproteobacteria bacterium]|nr:ribonuclease P protein component [Gammaproteobacteria bacterium]
MPLSKPSAGFPAEARLHLPAEFTRSFRQGFRITDTCFNVYAVRTENIARLGITVAKKTVAGAVGRNRIKRAVRESFRQQRAALPTLDIVVQAKPAAGHTSNAGLRQSLERHWQELIKRCAAS